MDSSAAKKIESDALRRVVFDDVCSITRLAGAEYSSVWKEDPEGPIIALRGFNIGPNKLSLHNVQRISEELSQKLVRSRLFKGDVVFPCVGTIGNAVKIEEDNRFHINQNIAKITPTPDLDSDFLVQFLISDLCKKEIQRFNATTSQPNVLVGSLRQFSLLLPPLAEQRKIAEILSCWDEGIEKCEALLRQVSFSFRELIKILLGDGRTKRESYITVTIDECCDILDTRRKPLNKEQRTDEIGNIPYYGANGRVGAVTEWIFDEPLILIAEDGGYFDEYKTRPIAYRIDGKAWVNNHAHVLRAKPKFDQNCIFFSLVHKDITVFLNGGTRAKLNRKELEKIEIHLPPTLAEQKSVSAALDAMCKEQSLLEEIIAKLRIEKQALMQKLLTGKIRVKV